MFLFSFVLRGTSIERVNLFFKKLKNIPGEDVSSEKVRAVLTAFMLVMIARLLRLQVIFTVRYYLKLKQRQSMLK